MTDLYLILHKVRGEPAFDIAQKIIVGKEEGWIIPTSGHRAYPSDIWKFDNLRQHIFGEVREIAISDLWRDLPDHCDAKRDTTPEIDHLRSLLRLKPKPANTYRRR
jgi:hypothetical protein